MNIQRYAWEDALIEAQTKEFITNGALLVALKLSRAIRWNPGGNIPSGLYWSNEQAFEFTGVSRATFYRHRAELFDTGFFISVNGNLIPQIPSGLDEYNLSQLETLQSHSETNQSQVETPKSQLEHTYK